MRVGAVAYMRTDGVGVSALPARVTSDAPTGMKAINSFSLVPEIVNSEQNSHYNGPLLHFCVLE